MKLFGDMSDNMSHHQLFVFVEVMLSHFCNVGDFLFHGVNHFFTLTMCKYGSNLLCEIGTTRIWSNLKFDKLLLL